MTGLYWSPPSAEQIARFGGAKTIEDFPEPEIDVWEENWESIELYVRNQTQWRSSVNGPTGLDYNVFYADMSRRAIPDDRQAELMDDIRIIESAARKEMSRPA